MPLQDAEAAISSDEKLMALDIELEKLEPLEPRCARVVELRYFVGLTEADRRSVGDLHNYRKARLGIRALGS